MGNRLTKHESPASPAKEENSKTPVKAQKLDSNKEQKKSTFQKLLARFQIRSKKSESLTPKSQNGDAKTVSPPPKPPLRNQSERVNSKHLGSNESLKQSQWTDIPLQVPDSPVKPKQEIEIKITPKPPPRKHKIKLHELLESPEHVDKIITFDQKESVTPDQRVPVEEPIIVPKKVVEHVCDGTHHHVRNIVNGKVVDQIVPLTSKEVKQNKSAAKHASTLSLPSYVDLKKKEEKRAPSPTKSSKKKSSASSLPIDKKVKPSATAAEKIESYMIRCKSFGSIIPHGKNEKVKTPDDNSDKESVDSWSGLEDWDLGIIEHDVSTDVPKVSSKNKIKKDEKVSRIQNSKQKEDLINSIKPDTKEFDELLDAMDHSFNKKQLSQSTAPLPIKPDSPKKTETSTGPMYPFKQNNPKNVFDNDAFFTNQFLLNERKSHRDEERKPEQSQMAPLAAFDSDRESEKDSALNIDSIDEVDEKECNSQTITTNKSKQNESDVQSAPKLIPRRKSSSGHSKLLKYIKDEPKTPETKLEGKIVQKHTIVTHQIVEKVEYVDKIQEPEIVPMIKNVDGLLNDLIKRKSVNDTALLDQESTISDLVETSSDDTRSTTKSTIEMSHQ